MFFFFLSEDAIQPQTDSWGSLLGKNSWDPQFAEHIYLLGNTYILLRTLIQFGWGIREKSPDEWISDYSTNWNYLLDQK